MSQECHDNFQQRAQLLSLVDMAEVPLIHQPNSDTGQDLKETENYSKPVVRQVPSCFLSYLIGKDCTTGAAAFAVGIYVSCNSYS